MRKYIFLLLCFIASTSFATANLTINVPLEEVELTTGHKAWISQNSDTELVSLSLIFKEVGNYFDPQGKAGLSYFMSSMLKEGVKGYNKEEIAKFQERYGINLSISNDNTQIKINLVTPYENLEKAMELLNLTLNYPTFPKDRLKKVHGQIESEYKNLLNNPHYYTRLKASDKFFAGTALVNVPNEETLQNISIKDLVRCLKESFTSQNILIGIAGKIDSILLDKYLPETLAKLPKNFTKKNFQPIELTSNRKAFFEDNTQFSTGIIQFYSKSFPLNFDYKMKLMLLNQIFGGHRFTARLIDSLRVKRGLVYGAYTDQIYNDFNHSVMSSISIDFDKVQEGLDSIVGEINKFHQDGIKNEELIIAKNSSTAETSLIFETDQSTSAALANFQNHFSTISEIKSLNDKINNISTEDLDQIIKEYFKPENFYFYVMGDKSKININFFN